MGASLGALAALHLQRRHPDRVAGLFLQSGSFFQPPSWTPAGVRVPALPPDRGGGSAAVRRHGPAGRAVPTVLTCGAAEENLAQQPDMAATLRRQGYPVALGRGAGRAQLLAWRDAFDPHLVGLLRHVWGHLEGRSA